MDENLAELDRVCKEFHSCISKILNVVDSKLPGNLDIDRLKRLIRLARDEDPLLVISKCKDKIWDAREHILTENEEFFLNKEYDQYIKKDANQAFIETLVTLVKEGHQSLSDEEKKYVWEVNKDLLTAVTEFKLLTDDYEE